MYQILYTLLARRACADEQWAASQAKSTKHLQQIKMSSAGIGTCLALVLLGYLAVSPAAAYYPTQRPTTTHGIACRPPYGFRPHACGIHEILNRTYDPACEYLWGLGLIISYAVYTECCSSTVRLQDSEIYCV